MKDWPGTDDEQLSLLRAVRNNCACEKPMGYTLKQAGCHELLIPDVTKWSRLIFMHREAGRLLIQELGPQKKMVPAPKYRPEDIVLIHQLGRR